MRVRTKKNTAKLILSLLAGGVALLGLFLLVGCGGGRDLTGASVEPIAGVGDVGTVTQAALAGTIVREGNLIHFTIENGQRGNGFMAQLWNKWTDGTSREGTPLFEQRGLGNGTFTLDATEWSCYDLQADLGGFEGGLLVSKQFAAWAPCPRPTPQPKPTPPPACEETQTCPPVDVCPNLEGVQETVPEGYELTEEGCTRIPPPPSCETDPSLCPPPPPPPPAGACYYRVSCGDREDSKGGGSSCTDRDQQLQCEAALGGDPAARGIWRNFGEQSLQNHCQFTVPGLSNRNFQLNPGQSADGCVNKNDD